MEGSGFGVSAGFDAAGLAADFASSSRFSLYSFVAACATFAQHSFLRPRTSVPFCRSETSQAPPHPKGFS
jgi:hypothetical protein